MTRNTIHALLAAATLIASTAPALAQKYYMRERITAMPKTVYDGTWSYGSWADSGSCNGTTKPQTRPASCQTDKTCDPSKQEPLKQDVACSTSCETVAGSRWTGKFINGNTEYRSHVAPINGTSEIQAACNSMAKTYGVGACFFSPTTRNGSPVWPSNVIYYEQYAWITFANRPELVAANCGQ